MSIWSREFTLEFIELQKQHQCLWKVQSKDYSNRQLKERAYEHLVQFVQKVDTNADRDSVIKKINNMRSSFRIEIKKIRNSKTSGSGAQDVYVPKLFYFEEMLFLQDQDIPRPAVSNIEPADEILDKLVEDDTTEDTQHSFYVESVSTAPESPIPPSQVIQPNSSQIPCQQPAKKIKKKAPEEDLLAIACSTLKNSSNTDKHDIFGQHLASTIREMALEQQIYAEKIISKVLFEGRLGNLSRNARLDVGTSVPVLPTITPTYNYQNRTASISTTTSAYSTGNTEIPKEVIITTAVEHKPSSA